MAGGGTGGHVTPLLAVVDELKKSEDKPEIVFVGSRGGVEEKLMPETGIRAMFIHSGKFRRYHRNLILNILDPSTIVKNIIDLKNFILGIFDSLKILKEEEPDVVFLKGGYVSLPFGIACRFKKYPYFIHESDVILGLANRLLYKRSEKIFVSFPAEGYKDIPEEKLVYSGNPIRKDLLDGEKKRGLKFFELDEKIKTIFVIGGSQGAHAINMLIFDKLEKYLEKYQIIHISGDYDYDWLEYKSKDIKGADERYKLFNFLSSELKDAFAVSDMVVARAGNNVLTEIAAAKKPSVIIPLESSANNHQLANAKAFSRGGGAYVLTQSHMTPEKLFHQVDVMLSDPEELQFLSEKIYAFYKEDATKIIVDEINSFYQKEKEE